MLLGANYLIFGYAILKEPSIFYIIFIWLDKIINFAKIVIFTLFMKVKEDVLTFLWL